MIAHGRERLAKRLAVTSVIFQALLFAAATVLALRAEPRTDGSTGGALWLLPIGALGVAAVIFAVLAFRFAPNQTVRRVFLGLSVSSVIFAAAFAVAHFF